MQMIAPLITAYHRQLSQCTSHPDAKFIKCL